MKEGFLSFVRLVGSVYFKKHVSSFVHETPIVLYTSLVDPALSDYEIHAKYLQNIRDMIWDKIQFEDELPPSMDALWRHWQRTCWVSQMWGEATKNKTTLPDVNDFGWKMSEGRLQYDWESDENRIAVQERVGFLLRGCSCSSSTACSSRRCSCVKKGRLCRAGCNCRNCKNTAPSCPQSHPEQHSIVEEEELVLDMQQRESMGDELVYVDEDELLADVLVVVNQSEESSEEEEDCTSSSDEL